MSNVEEVQLRKMKRLEELKAKRAQAQVAAQPNIEAVPTLIEAKTQQQLENEQIIKTEVAKNVTEANTAALIQILNNIPKHATEPPRARTSKTKETFTNKTSTTTCINITRDATRFPFDSSRTISWCIPKGDKIDCEGKHTICFNVDEVQAYINSHMPVLSDEEMKQQPQAEQAFPQIPMFALDLLQAANEEYQLETEFSEFMSEEFVFTFTHFDIVTGERGQLEASGASDRKLMNIVLDSVRRFILASLGYAKDAGLAELGLPVPNKLEGQTWLGVFWNLTKKALAGIAKAGAKLLYFILKSPFWTTIALLALKFTRSLLCVYLSGGETQEVILDALYAKIEREFGGQWGGIPRFVLKMSRTALGCGVALYTLNASGGVTCLSQAAQAAWQQLAGPVTSSLEILTNGAVTTIGWIMTTAISLTERTNLPKLLNWASNSVLYHTAMGATDSELTSHRLALIVNAVKDWDGGYNFELGGFMVLMSIVPTGLVVRLLSYFFPQYAAQLKIAHSFAQLTFFWQQYENIKRLYAEVKEWIFDVFPCFWTIIKNNFWRLIGYEKVVNAEDPSLGIACCLADLINAINNAVTTNPLLVMSKRIKAGWRMPEVGWGDVLGNVGCGMTLNFFWGCTPSMQTNEGDISLANHWLVATDPDESDFVAPFYKFDDVPFGVYFTRDVGGRPLLQVTIPFGYAQQHYPKACFKANNQHYILLAHLPKKLVSHLARFQTPAMDMSKVLSIQE